MKNTHSLVVSVSTIKDIDKIKENTKYINIDITNCNHDIIDYFLKHGHNYLYSEIIDNTKGYSYVSFEDFYKAETIINAIYTNSELMEKGIVVTCDATGGFATSTTCRATIDVKSVIDIANDNVINLVKNEQLLMVRM